MKILIEIDADKSCKACHGFDDGSGRFQPKPVCRIFNKYLSYIDTDYGYKADRLPACLAAQKAAEVRE